MGWDTLSATQQAFLRKYIVPGGGSGVSTSSQEVVNPEADARRSSRRSFLQALEARIDSMAAEING